ncbi:hypothetical protein ScPMuIL_008568 [Solemya velum]
MDSNFMTSNSIYGTSVNPNNLFEKSPWQYKPVKVPTSTHNFSRTVGDKNKSHMLDQGGKTKMSVSTLHSGTQPLTSGGKDSIDNKNTDVKLENVISSEDFGPTSTQEELDQWAIADPEQYSVGMKKSERKIFSPVDEVKKGQSKKFSPVDNVWQGKIAQKLNLSVVKYINYGSKNDFFQNTPPSSTVAVAGDGNCFFRAMSMIMTGSESSHMELRHAVLKHVARHPECYRSFLTSRGGMRTYLTDMRQSGEWATDREILATATMLKVVIEVYSKKYGWQSFKPLDDPDLSGPSIYISNIGDHFEPVTAI